MEDVRTLLLQPSPYLPLFVMFCSSGDLPGDAMLRLHSGKLLNLGTLRGSVTGYRKFSLAYETIIVLHTCERYNLSLDQSQP